jgi:thioredoxin 1
MIGGGGAVSYSFDLHVRIAVSATYPTMSQHVQSASSSTKHAGAEPVPMVTESNFAEVVLASPIPVLVDFGAEWCPPCRAIEPIIDLIAERYEGRVRVVRMDADASPKIAARYRVRALPTVITFSGGEEHKRHTGATSFDKFVELLPNMKP